MKVFIIGRTKYLLSTIDFLQKQGHSIAGIWAAKSSDYDKTTGEEFKKIAEQIGCFFYVGGHYNSDILYAVKSLQADIAVSINFPYIIKQELIECFSCGILNAHAGDLPRYRGNAIVNWAILNQEPHVALSIHFMEGGRLDSGPIVHKEYFPLLNTTYVTDVYTWLEDAIPKSFSYSLSAIENGESGKPQRELPGAVLNCYPRRPDDSRICWNQSAFDVVKLVRASSYPFLGAYTFLEGQEKVVIWKAKVKEPDFLIMAVPGQIVDNQYVVAGDYRLVEFEEISPLCFDQFSRRKRFI
ncbi:MAG: formyltransferase family protein [Alphaproteobacteria bacterium]